MSHFISATRACACCSDLLRARFDRRRFLTIAGVTTLAATLPRVTFAAEGQYEAMVVGCIDPRLQEPVHAYTNSRDLTGKFSQFIVAGAAVGIVAPAFKDWHKTFWDNLAASRQLHRIPKVIVIDHRDCGAAKIAYGEDAVATPAKETETHRAALADFRQQLRERHSDLKVETGLMALDGKIEMFS